MTLDRIEASNPASSRAGKLLDNGETSETARHEAKHALADSERRLNAVVDNATVAIFLMDERQHCTFMNAAAEELTGYSFAEVQGRPLHDVVHHTRPDGTHYPLQECPIDRALPEQNRVQGEELFVHKDGHFYPVAFTASPIRDDSGQPIGTILEVRSVAEEKAAAEALREESRTLETLNRTGAALAGELDLDRLVQMVTDAGVELTGAKFGAFFYNVLNDKGESYVLYTLSGVDRSDFERFPMPRATAVFGPTFRGEGVVRSDDILADPRYGKNVPNRGMPEGHLPVRSYLAVPVISRSSEVIGGLFFGHPEPGRFAARHERLTVGIAAQAAIAIDNARLFQAAEQELAERRRVEEELKAREIRLRLALAAGQLGEWELDLETDTALRALRHDRIFGHDQPVENWGYETFIGHVLPEDRQHVDKAFRAAVENGTGWHFECRIRRAGDGEIRWIEASSEPLTGNDGRVVKIFGLVGDITARKAAEEALRESERKFRAIADTMPQIVWSTRADGYHDYFNRRWYEFTGLSPEDSDGEGWNPTLHPEDRERAWTAWRHSLETGDPYEVEYRFRSKDGSYRWFIGRALAIRNERGEIERWFGTCTDVQEIIEARDVLARSREELEREVEARTAERDNIWRYSNDMMAVMEFNGRRRAINPAWSRILGHGEEMLLTTPFFELTHPDDREKLAQAVQQLAAGKPIFQFEDRLRHKDGSYRLISWTGVPGKDVFYAIGRDVTEQRATEEALHQAQKMEAVGQLTGGIAHDFNNLLTGIIGGLDMMQRRISQGRTGEIERYTTAAMTAANRAAALTHRLLAFSRRQPLDPKPVEANRLVTGMEELLRRTIGEAIQLEIVTAGGLWLTKCDPNQLESAILNLAINARDAMPGGGKLTIETCNAHLDSAYAAKSREVRPGQYVCICVTDTGTGMSPDVIAKAFEPFFTTKPIGQGTGLGLSMIYGFTRQSNGYAKIYSEIGKGTTIKLYLPRHYGEGEDIEGGRPALSEVHRAEHGEVVLVVEDEIAVRDLVVDLLGDLGYRAVEAADGPSGLKLLQSDMRIDLLVTDVGLPGLNGRQLADAARQSRPDLKVLFMTGYAENAAIANGFLEPGMQMITKPFAVDALATRIRDIIEGN
jgi:PAS domain S-box-containing protein